MFLARFNKPSICVRCASICAIISVLSVVRVSYIIFMLVNESSANLYSSIICSGVALAASMASTFKAPMLFSKATIRSRLTFTQKARLRHITPRTLITMMATFLFIRQIFSENTIICNEEY